MTEENTPLRYTEQTNVALEERISDLEFAHKKLLNQMSKIIEEEVNMKVKSSLEQEGFKQFLIETTKKFLKQQFTDFVRSVVKETLESMNKKIKDETKVARALCQSIDEDVKHLTRGLDLSYEMDKRIEKMIIDRTDEFFNALRIGTPENINLKIEQLEFKEDDN